MASLKELWTKWFHPKKQEDNGRLTYSQLVSLFDRAFDPDEKAEANATFVSGVNAHAAFFSQIRPTLYVKKVRDTTRSGLNYLLQIKPNALDTAPLFWQRCDATLFYKNYALIWIQRSEKDYWTPTAFWLIDTDSNDFRIGRGSDGRLWLRFSVNGQVYFCPGDDVIILQRESNPSDIIAGRSRALAKILSVVDTSYSGLERAVQQSMVLRFIIQGATVYNDKDRAQNEADMNKILSGANAAAYISAGDKVTEVANQGKWPLAPEIQNVEDKINAYLGITNAIAKGDFTEAQWNSFFARSISPICAQLESELNAKCLTPDEYYKGNEIRVVTERLEVLGMDSRLKKAQLKLQMPIVVTNDIRQDIGEEPIEDGDKPQANLNWVGAKNQDAYQGDKTPEKKDPPDNGGEGGKQDA